MLLFFSVMLHCVPDSENFFLCASSKKLDSKRVVLIVNLRVCTLHYIDALQETVTEIQRERVNERDAAAAAAASSAAYAEAPSTSGETSADLRPPNNFQTGSGSCIPGNCDAVLFGVYIFV